MKKIFLFLILLTGLSYGQYHRIYFPIRLDSTSAGSYEAEGFLDYDRLIAYRDSFIIYSWQRTVPVDIIIVDTVASRRWIEDSLNVKSPTTHKYWYNNNTTTMVRTFGNQDIAGIKTFLNNLRTKGTLASGDSTIAQGSVILYDGTTNNYSHTILGASLTANRTITLPNATGTVSLVGHTHSSLTDVSSGTPIVLGVTNGIVTSLTKVTPVTDGIYHFYTGGISGNVSKMEFKGGVCIVINVEP